MVSIKGLKTHYRTALWTCRDVWQSLFLLKAEEALDILASLLAESEGVAVEEDGKDGEEQSDDLEALFDDEAKSEEEYKDEIDEMLTLSENLDKEGEQDDRVQKDIGAATTSQDLQGLQHCSASISNAWQI